MLYECVAIQKEMKGRRGIYTSGKVARQNGDSYLPETIRPVKEATTGKPNRLRDANGTRQLMGA